MSRYLLPTCILIVSLLFLILPSVWAVTPEGNGRTVAVPWVDRAPTIDGDLTDWPSTPVLGLDAFSAAHKEGQPPFPDPADASMQLSMVWDATYLYVAMRVQDDVLVNDSGAAVWQDDEIELGFDGNHNFAGPDAVDHQFTFNPDGRITDFAVPTEVLQAVITPTATGWTVEAAIPLSLFRGSGLRNGDKIGFTFALRDDDDGGSWDHKFLWQGVSTSEHWEQFGALQFVQGPIRNTALLRLGENGYHSMVDTWINSFETETNYADHDVLEARSTGQAAALFYFDLSPLPTEASIEQATFQLHTRDRSNSNAADFAIYGLRRYWDVGTVTWEQANTNTHWGQA
ncbi:MAG: DNRLRE domain-containing protein, partial [Chloroflexi bacterium]|nr:DNRLRE domain-containing protein [Chloroflexota bacterium]